MNLSVVILSKNGTNLQSSVMAIRHLDKSITSIIVVDDGLDMNDTLPNVRYVPGAKPFVFARNANIGIEAAGRDDIVLLNDDAVLETPDGLWRLALFARLHPEIGALSAAIRGTVANALQAPRDTNDVRILKSTVAFVAVYLSRRAIDAVGGFDERFDGYGFEDYDYCKRLRAAGFEVGVCDCCVIEHGSLPSTFRERPDILELGAQNRSVYREKWESANALDRYRE